MKISALMENTARELAPDAMQRTPFLHEHGLSVHISLEDGTNILFDAGQSGAFAKNTETLGIALEDVDYAVLSHGHYDHSGGMETFLAKNTRAPLFVHKKALGAQYAVRSAGKLAYIGIAPSLAASPRLVFVEEDRDIAPAVRLFSSVHGTDFWSPTNDALRVSEQGLLSEEARALAEKSQDLTLPPDPFLHEQNLLLQENGKNVLIAGCAHRGIVNIVERAVEIVGAPMTLVIGGFHLSNPATGKAAPQETIVGIAERLLTYPTTQYMTCHCTGQASYLALKSIMGDALDYFSAGTVLKV